MRNPAQEVISLLSSWSRCLERLLELSSKFLTRAREGDLSGLQAFHSSRVRFFRAIELYDDKLAELVAGLPAASRAPELRSAIERELRRRERVTRAVLEADQAIMEEISRESARLLEGIASTRRSQAAIARFRSGRVGGSGEGLDRTL